MDPQSHPAVAHGELAAADALRHHGHAALSTLHALRAGAIESCKPVAISGDAPEAGVTSATALEGSAPEASYPAAAAASVTPAAAASGGGDRAFRGHAPSPRRSLEAFEQLGATETGMAWRQDPTLTRGGSGQQDDRDPTVVVLVSVGSDREPEHLSSSAPARGVPEQVRAR